MTITELIRFIKANNITQYVIFQRADRMFNVGRFYGGGLSIAEVIRLME